MNWEEMFVKYVDLVGCYEGIAFLYREDWSNEEWAEFERLGLV